MTDLKSRYLQAYAPMITEFATSIRDLTCSGLPRIFLPSYGSMYESAPIKIMFVGWETNGWGDLSQIIDYSEYFGELQLDGEMAHMSDYWYINEGRQHGRYWNFVFRFLAEFHDLENIDELEGHDLLNTFAWGNTSSFERFEVSSKMNQANPENWKYVKELSRKFDSGKLLAEVFRPDIMVINNWSESDKWLVGDTQLKPEKLENHLWYYYLQSTGTHVLWTAHPSYLSRQSDYKAHIQNMVSLAKTKTGIKSKNSIATI